MQEWAGRKQEEAAGGSEDPRCWESGQKREVKGNVFGGGFPRTGEFKGCGSEGGEERMIPGFLYKHLGSHLCCSLS